MAGSRRVAGSPEASPSQARLPRRARGCRLLQRRGSPEPGAGEACPGSLRQKPGAIGGKKSPPREARAPGPESHGPTGRWREDASCEGMDEGQGEGARPVRQWRMARNNASSHVPKPCASKKTARVWLAAGWRAMASWRLRGTRWRSGLAPEAQGADASPSQTWRALPRVSESCFSNRCRQPWGGHGGGQHGL